MHFPLFSENMNYHHDYTDNITGIITIAENCFRSRELKAFKTCIFRGWKKIAGNGKTCWQNCIQRILDDIIGSHANTVSINDFENNLKKYFENIVFRDIRDIKEKGNVNQTYCNVHFIGKIFTISKH